MAWVPLGVGSAAHVNWGAMSADARLDPYLAWQDFTGFLGKPEPSALLPLILELRRPLKNQADLSALNATGLRLTPHYINFKYPNEAAPRYVTARFKGLTGLRRFVQAVADSSHDFVVRYEVSGGVRNPDASYLERGSQKWLEPAPTYDSVEGNVVGFIDYGCAFLHRSFQDEWQTSRIRWLWNQQDKDGPTPSRPRKALKWQPNERFARGNEVDGSALKDFSDRYRTGGELDELACYRDAEYEPIRRQVTHGAHIMDVATGYPDVTLHRRNKGTQRNEPIIFVQLPRFLEGEQVSGLLRAQVLDAAHYIAAHLDKQAKCVINLSYGSNCGPHDGSSIIECALDELIAAHEEGGRARVHVVLPSGNALDRSVHAQLHLRTGETACLGWENVPNDPSDSFVELWVPATAEIRVCVTPPSGTPSPWVRPGAGARLERGGKTAALLMATTNPCQSEAGALLLMAVAPTASSTTSATAPYGTWRIDIENVGSGSALVNAWCERDDPVFGNEAGPRQSQFTDHVEKTGTLNSIAHGRKTIVVGGYEVHDFSTGEYLGPVAAMSGTGPGRDLAGRDRHPSTAKPAQRGPQALTPCSIGLGEDGIAAAAVLSAEQTRLTGTSVSAAYFTRQLIANNFDMPRLDANRSRPKEPPPMPGRDPHPDDGEVIPRLP